jgi:tRNA A-37 threonylcarbamoyl transferase component Bud32
METKPERTFFSEIFRKIQLCWKYKENSKFYFEKCFQMLSNRLESDNRQVSELIFTSYLDLPIVISSKIFKAFDKDGDGFLNSKEFVEGMNSLYFGSLRQIEEVTFCIFDFKNSSLIFKEDLISLMNYMNNLENILYNIEFHVEEFFGNNLELTLEEYCQRIELQNSNLLILFLTYIYKKQIFTEDTLNFFSLNFNSIKDIQKQNMLNDIHENYENEREIAYFNTTPNEKSSSMNEKLEKICSKDEYNISKNYMNISHHTSNISYLHNSEEKEILYIFPPSEEVLYLFKYLFKPFVGVKRKNNNKNVLQFDSENSDRKLSRKKTDSSLESYLLHEKLEIDQPITVFSSFNELKLLYNNDKFFSGKILNQNESKTFSGASTLYLAKDETNKVSQGQKKFSSTFLKNSHYTSNSTHQYENSLENIKLMSPEISTNLLNTETISKVRLSNKYLESFETPRGYESTVYKLTSKNELRKQKIVIIDKDLFLFRFSFSKNDYVLESIEPLSGLFVTICEETTIANRTYYALALLNQYGNIMTHINNLFFYRKKKDLEKAVSHIKSTLGFREIKNDYEILADLGKGQFGKVKLGVNKKTLTKVAIKIIEKKKMKGNELDLVRNEIDVMKIIKNSPHENIVVPYDFFEDKMYIYIVMEYLKGCNLNAYLLNAGINEELNKNISKQIAKGLYHLHNLGIIHRDIKLDNIMICDMTTNTSNISVKLLDFGLSKCLLKTEKTNEGFGTLVFTAPEILGRKPYDLKIDVWSFGILVFYLNCRKFPFDGKDLSLSEIGKKICYDTVSFYKCNLRPEVEDLILYCLKKNPQERPNVEDILQSEWLA